ncbi:ParB/RepB/Spo0J family partition protein [Streptomyces violaceusniger]|uniref:ParB/RepB/Spo0J family partition protein n=1 Tax=Streptomyces violaceusniger TaxID=68280 RepID=UPI0037F3FFF5
MPAHDEFDDFLDDDDDPEVIDTKAEGRLLRVPLARLSPNFVNPRTDFGTKEDLEDFGKSLRRRQNQAVPVVTKAAYLKLWPENKKKIGKVDFVIVSGERRYRAGDTVGLPALDCVINDRFAESRKTFMEAVVSENVDRQNFDPVEEAYAVQALVKEFGTNRAVAQHFERADGWITQRILLTHLAPELQSMVRTKSIPLEHARTLGKLTKDNGWSTQQQVDWWSGKRSALSEMAQERKAEKQAAKAAGMVPAPSPAPAAEKEPPIQAEAPRPSVQPSSDAGLSPQHQDPEPESFTAVKLEQAEDPPEGLADSGQTSGDAAVEVPPVAVVMPWGKPAAVLQILREYMEPADLEQLAKEVLS